MKRLLRIVSWAAIGLFAAMRVLAADADVAVTYHGTPATVATRSVRGVLRVTPEPRDPLTMSLDLTEFAPAAAEPLRRFDVEMTKKAHLILVSDDFSTFMHVHPMLGSDGHFRMTLTVPRAAVYHAYADTDPVGFGHQVVRFDFTAGVPGRGAAARSAARSSRMAAAGPYNVILDGADLHAGEMAMLSVHVRRGNAPARDLHPYLGGMAHAVFINTSSLAYVHAHPIPLMAAMSMPMSMSSPVADLPNDAVISPDMMLHVNAPDPGIYRLWFQFRGGSRVYVAPFQLVVR